MPSKGVPIERTWVEVEMAGLDLLLDQLDSLLVILRLKTVKILSIPDYQAGPIEMTFDIFLT